MWTLTCLLGVEGNCTAGSSGQNCGCSPKDQYVITVMSQGLLIVLCKDRQMAPRRQQELMFILLLRHGCSWYEYFSYLFLHWRGMTGTVVQLSSRVLQCDWLALTGHGGSCHKARHVGTSFVFALFCGKGHTGNTSQTSQLVDILLEHFIWAWHAVTSPSPLAFGYNNPLLIH